MKLGKISKEFNAYFEIGTDDELEVTQKSCKLFARIIALKAIEEFKASLVPDGSFKNIIAINDVWNYRILDGTTLYALSLGETD